MVTNSNWLFDKHAVSTALHCDNVMQFMLHDTVLICVHELQEPVHLLHEAGIEACELTNISLHTPNNISHEVSLVQP